MLTVNGKKHRFILSDEKSVASNRTELKQIKCRGCTEVFYVGIHATPSCCPYCKHSLDAPCESSYFPFICSITNIGFSDEEAHDDIFCAHLDRTQACDACDKVIKR